MNAKEAQHAAHNNGRCLAVLDMHAHERDALDCQYGGSGRLTQVTRGGADADNVHVRESSQAAYALTTTTGLSSCGDNAIKSVTT